MAPPTPIKLSTWQAMLHRLEDVFGIAVPAGYRAGTIDLDRLLVAMSDLSTDPGKKGQFVIQYELRQELAAQLGIPPTEILETTRMAALLPDRDSRRRAMLALQTQLDWRLPRLGLPVWAQYIWGAGLLTGFVLQFIYTLIGTILFWGGMLLSFQVEKVAWAFQYPMFGKWVGRTVQLNWPALEMGAADGERLRVAFADALEAILGQSFDPRQPFPQVVVDDRWQAWPPQHHLLNGDSLRLSLEALDIPGDRIVWRECMVVGPVQGQADFFAQRTHFIHITYQADPAKYQQWVMAEIERLHQVPADAELNLWFEEDLFCQANLWCVLELLAARSRQAQTFLVLPSLFPAPRRVTGFAKMSDRELAEALQARIPLQDSDFALGQRLWNAFQQNDLVGLQALAQQPATHWRCLPEVVQAHVERTPDAAGLGRPQRILQAIIAEGQTDFAKIFEAFSAQASIYGFGDLQVQALLDEMQHKPAE
jgi:hypothetical protein